MKKALSIAFITLFFAMCAVPLIGRIFGYVNVNSEKRALAEAPAVFNEGGFNEGFTREFDDYFTDNFAFRPNLVTMYAYMNEGLLKESISDQVIIGKDGWLFFEPTLDDYLKVNTLSENDIYRLTKTLDLQRRWLEGRGVAFLFTAAPNKASLYGQYMPDRLKPIGSMSNVEMLYQQLQNTPVNYIDLHSELRGREEQLYHKLDTHWNGTGALIAYNVILGSVKELIPEFEFDSHKGALPVVERTWEGDLSAMLYPAAGMLDEQADYAIEKEFTTKRPMKSLEDITIQTKSEYGKLRLLMFRDSFANALIPILSNEFASVTYSRAVPYDYRLMDEGADVVIMEIAERNIPNMLKKAPLMQALEAELTDEPVPADIEITLDIKDTKDYVKLTGIALPPGYSAGENYDYYVRLSMGGQYYTFEPFPILEEGYFEEYADKSNAAFSMILYKGTLPPGEYSVQVIVSHSGRYLIDEAGYVSLNL